MTCVGKVERQMIECDFHNARWQLWYQDMFDPETPRLVEAEGLGLELGLGELWSHHLTESVLPNGARGFARFNLWWVQAGRSFSIEGEWQGQVQLRNWVFPPGATDQDEALLHQIAKAHLALVPNRAQGPRFEGQVAQADQEWQRRPKTRHVEGTCIQGRTHR